MRKDINKINFDSLINLCNNMQSIALVLQSGKEIFYDEIEDMVDKTIKICEKVVKKDLDNIPPNSLIPIEQAKEIFGIYLKQINKDFK